MSDDQRTRLTVAVTARTRLRLARELLLDAVQELESIRFAVAPALDATRRAAESAALAAEHVTNLITRIPT